MPVLTVAGPRAFHACERGAIVLECQAGDVLRRYERDTRAAQILRGSIVCSMSIPQNKAELLQAIQTTHERLIADLSGVPSDRAREATLEGHAKDTRMSPADLVAYLVGWGLLVVKWCDLKAKGEPVDFPETGYQWNELGRLAQKFYADHAHQDYRAMLLQLADVHARLMSLVESNSDEALYGAPWYEKYTLGRMIQLNTSSPNANARARIRKWKKMQHLA